MRAGRIRIAMGAALLLVAVAWSAAAQPPLEEELVNPSEVVFENGQPYVYADGGMQALRTRQQGGETLYYRMVRYDPQEGYVTGGDTGATVAASPQPFAVPSPTPMRYYGQGHLYRPDFYNSPYNRDARQRYSGPGYFGSCSRYDGCKEVQVVPLWPYGRY